MKCITAVLLLLVAVAVQAQTPAPVVQHFALSLNAGAYGDKGAQPVTIAGASVQITKNFSAGYNQIWNPNDASQPNYRLFVGNYTRELADICPVCKRKFVFDTTNILLTFQGGIGTVKWQGANHHAEDVGIFASLPLADHVSYQLLGYQRLFGNGVPSATIKRNQITTGIYFTF